MDWSVLLNYALGIAFFVALFFVVRYKDELEQRTEFCKSLERENEFLNDSILEALKNVRCSGH